MYVVNYKQGGYALVSADKRVQAPILALIDKGCFNINVAKMILRFYFLQEKLQTMQEKKLQHIKMKTDLIQ